MVNIYKISNKINNKVYIGRTSQHPETRLKQHILGMGNGKNMPIHLAISKYGKENFTIEVIYVCSEEKDAGYAELFYIDKFNSLAPNGYNVDLNTKFMKDNPYLIEENKNSSAVQSIQDDPAKADYNSCTRVRYPIELWNEIKTLYLEGKSPEEINELLNTEIPKRTLVFQLKALGCDTSNKARNKFRGNGKFFITDSEKENIIQDYKDGFDVSSLVKKYNRANQAIRKILVKAKLYFSTDKHICRTME